MQVSETTRCEDQTSAGTQPTARIAANENERRTRDFRGTPRSWAPLSQHVRQKKNMKVKTILVLFAATLMGCDTFFAVSGTVTDGRTGLPLPGARATLVLDKGAGEADTTRISTNDGRVGMIINEPPNAWATLTIEKPGYQKWSTQFQGAPEKPLVIRLWPENENQNE